ncbi:phosphoribosyltransferase family protein [Aneurinibacillus migulanus]|uniref:phosphoribosyltransferase family protein n=1 Tax=Aneurinibacillus migulanus TaxID=47500 RepID=UPI002E1E430A|nr:phosphoribosyltransferase family protein [Aneurinibacillus migulanus]
MKIKTLPTSLPNQYLFNILGDLSIDIKVTNNPYQLPLEQLFLMAARKNKKRSFLFVSQILGKHIPVHPSRSLLSGIALANLYASIILNQSREEQMEAILQGLQDETIGPLICEKMLQSPISLSEKTLFIGFAETATALGHSMFGSFGNNANYIHTTREWLIDERWTISFEEEHSHAVSHRCYCIDDNFLKNDYPIVLVDDEITTGKTALNIIRSIQKVSPRRRYTVASLLDWRSPKNRQKFKETEEQLGVQIRTISLVEGEIIVHGKPMIEMKEPSTAIGEKQCSRIEKIELDSSYWSFVHKVSSSFTGIKNELPYLYETGRFGIDSDNQVVVHHICKKVGSALQKKRKGNRTLCMGTGEFMFLPMRIASYMGEGVHYQSSTRSPIHPNVKEGYGIQNAFAYPSPDDPTILNYFYNIPAQTYDEVFVFFEREADEQYVQPMIEQLMRTGIPRIILVFCSVKNHSKR